VGQIIIQNVAWNCGRDVVAVVVAVVVDNK
jgi:hypothetical protein